MLTSNPISNVPTKSLSKKVELRGAAICGLLVAAVALMNHTESALSALATSP